MGPYNIGATVWPGLSKMIEEAGEVQQIAGKIIATGGETAHWDGTDLRCRLEEEIADLEAALQFVARHNALDLSRIDARAQAKLALFERWHAEQIGR